ncbi:MAG TPA: hypothetical protein PKA55_06335 [Rhodoblastus sp.]|nr:hypothetical protein [Rhodoblastus sp.]
MLNPNFRANDAVSVDASQPAHDAIPLAVLIATDDQATAQALVTACEFMTSFACRVRVAALRGDPAHLRVRPDEILIVDMANAFGRRLDPACYPASPSISVLHAPDDRGAVEFPQTHAALRFADIAPAALELAVRVAQYNCRSTMLARRAAESAERSAVAAREAQSRAREEISPIAHALEGLLEIMSADADAADAPAPSQFRLLRNWTRDLVRAIGRYQDGTGPVATPADVGAIVEDAVALFRPKADGLGHTVVLSTPAEPVLAPVDRQLLQTAVRQLIECALDREGSDRRIDIVLWRSMEDVRLALVSGPPVRRDPEAADECALPPVRAAGLADADFVGALALLRELGATIESNCATTSGASLLVSLPLA